MALSDRTVTILVFTSIVIAWLCYSAIAIMQGGW
jgi:hypothetical protein